MRTFLSVAVKVNLRVSARKGKGKEKSLFTSSELKSLKREHVHPLYGLCCIDYHCNSLCFYMSIHMCVLTESIWKTESP